MKSTTNKILKLKDDSTDEESTEFQGAQKETDLKFKEADHDDISEALEILGLHLGTLKFSQDYKWMVETTRHLLQQRGISYFRKDVLRLMRAWDNFRKS